jgi:hypothetical protein
MSFEVLDATDVCLFLGTYSGEASKATWSSPGVLNIKRQELVVGQPPGDDAALARWNSAWGVVSKGGFLLGNGGAIAASTSTTIASVTATLLAGRRYLLKLWANGWSASSSMTGYFYVNASGNSADFSGAPWKWTGGTNDNLNVEWAVVVGVTATANGALLAGPQTFTVRFVNQSAVAGTHYNDQGFFDVFDVGPVTPAAVSPPAGEPAVVAAGNALGIVAMGSMLPLTSIPSGTTTITNPLAFTSLVGRRYRLSYQIRVIGATTGNGVNIKFLGSGLTGVGWDLWHATTVNYSYIKGDAVFDGTGVTSTYGLTATVTGTLGVWLDAVSNFYIEDMGPNTAPALPIPVTPPTWTPMGTLLNGWVWYGGVEMPPAYRKIGDMVQVRGTIKNATPSPGATQAFYTLPVGFRPVYTHTLPCMGVDVNDYGCPGIVVVSTNGSMQTVRSASNQKPHIETLFEFQFSVTP